MPLYFKRRLPNPRVQPPVLCLSPHGEISINIQQTVIYMFEHNQMEEAHRTPIYVPLRHSLNCPATYRVSHFLTGICVSFYGNLTSARKDFPDYRQSRVAAAYSYFLGDGDEGVPHRVALFEDSRGRMCYILEWNKSLFAYFPVSVRNSESEYIELHVELVSRADGMLLALDLDDFLTPPQIQMLQGNDIPTVIPRVRGNDIVFPDIIRYRDNVFFITWAGSVYVVFRDLTRRLVQHVSHENRDHRRRWIDNYKFVSTANHLYLLCYMTRREMVVYELIEIGGDFVFQRVYNLGDSLLVVMRDIAFSVSPMLLRIQEYDLRNKVIVFTDDYADDYLADLYSVLSAEDHAKLEDAHLAIPYDAGRVVDIKDDVGVMYHLSNIFTSLALE